MAPCTVVDKRAADGDEAAAAAAALSLIHRHRALAKTVRNSDWLSLLRRLKASGRFRTSASLLPPSGHMHLYGRVRPGAVGLIFDGGAVDLQHALCWPSGVFAKTEHHLHVGADGTVTLSGPCRLRLSSLEGLRAANEEADRRHAVWQHAGGERPEPSLYNEVSVETSGKDVAAIFVRSHEERHLVLALGLRSLFRHLFCGRPLPLLRITPEGGACVVAHDEQLALLSAACAPGGLPWACDASGVAPRLPIDASDFPELQPQQRLALHASLGLTHASLRASLAEALSRPASDQPAALAPLLASCLVAAASSGNVASAREIVRVSAPLLLASVAPPPATAATAPVPAPVPASAPAPAGRPASCSHPGSCPPLAEPLLPPQPLAPSNAYAEWSGGGSSALESVGSLQRACATARSDAMLVPLGAQITLAEFVSGGTARRLDGACEWIEEWLRRSEADAACPSPASLAFRFASWLEARRVDGNSDWLSFLTGRALRNRRHFLSQLYALRRSASDGQAYVAQLFAITSRLRQPCLRLRILQQVLGLDERFSRDIVHGVICLACDVVESMATRAPSREPRPHSPPGEVEPPGAGGAARVSARKATIGLLLSLDDFDEATRLEADALFFPGPGSPRPRPSDPVGESERRSRVEHFYRDGSAPVLVGTATSPS